MSWFGVALAILVWRIYFFLYENTAMNDERYLAMLNENIPPTMTLDETTIFMHNGALCHGKKIISEWLNDNEIGVLDRPVVKVQISIRSRICVLL